MADESGKRPQVHIFSDGSCSPNPGPGGWAAILRCSDPQMEKEIFGYELATTNNRMELIAATRALQALRRPCDVVLTTDSEYLANAFRRGWIAKWKRNGWKTASKEPVKNQDLWQALDELVQKHRVRWAWIAGHAGHAENERCDELANRAREIRLNS